MPRKPNPERIDADAQEATAAWFAQARPAKDVLAEIVGAEAAKDMLKPRRGRPALDHPKEHVNIRLDADVVGAFRQGGVGWQTRINNALRDWLKAHPTARDA
jgi:uncharacterized protein (DUF4415 family)